LRCLKLQDGDEGGDFHNAYLDFMQQNHTFDDTFIERKKAKKKKQVNLDDFIGEDDDSEQIDKRLDS
jgi:hypothetical protein